MPVYNACADADAGAGATTTVDAGGVCDWLVQPVGQSLDAEAHGGLWMCPYYRGSWPLHPTGVVKTGLRACTVQPDMRGTTVTLIWLGFFSRWRHLLRRCGAC